MNTRYVESVECWNDCLNASKQIQDRLESLGFSSDQSIDGDELKTELAMIIQRNLKPIEDKESPTYNE